MGTAADGSTCRVQLMENGIEIAVLDGITGFSSDLDIATRQRLTLGRQGSSIEQDITGASGTIPVSMVLPAVQDMCDRYIQAVLSKTRTNITIVETFYYPETGDTRVYVYGDVRFTARSIQVARQQDSTISLPWSCGSVGVLT